MTDVSGTSLRYSAEPPLSPSPDCRPTVGRDERLESADYAAAIDASAGNGYAAAPQRQQALTPVTSIAIVLLSAVGEPTSRTIPAGCGIRLQYGTLSHHKWNSQLQACPIKTTHRVRVIALDRTTIATLRLHREGQHAETAAHSRPR